MTEPRNTTRLERTLGVFLILGLFLLTLGLFIATAAAFLLVAAIF